MLHALQRRQRREGCKIVENSSIESMCIPQELDRVQGRGLQGAKSPLLWEDSQVREYLAGSPLIGEIKERLKVSPEGADICEVLTGL